MCVPDLPQRYLIDSELIVWLNMRATPPSVNNNRTISITHDIISMIIVQTSRNVTEYNRHYAKSKERGHFFVIIPYKD